MRAFVVVLVFAPRDHAPLLDRQGNSLPRDPVCSTDIARGDWMIAIVPSRVRWKRRCTTPALDPEESSSRAVRSRVLRHEASALRQEPGPSGADRHQSPTPSRESSGGWVRLRPPRVQIWIVASSMHPPVSVITITQSSAEPLGGAGGPGAATGGAGAVGMLGTLSREHPARATITRMVRPNFMSITSRRDDGRT